MNERRHARTHGVGARCAAPHHTTPRRKEADAEASRTAAVHGRAPFAPSFLPSFPHKRPLIRACGARREANLPNHRTTLVPVPVQARMPAPRRTPAPSPTLHLFHRRAISSAPSLPPPRSSVRPCPPPNLKLTNFRPPRRPSPSSVAAHRLRPARCLPLPLT